MTSGLIANTDGVERWQQGLDGRRGPTESALASSTGVGELNRARVLQALCERGPLSRAELAALTGSTRAAIGNIASALVAGGLLEERQPRAGAGRRGKPGRPLWFAPGAGLSAAVALTAGRVDAAVVDAGGNVLALRSRALPDDAGGVTVARVVVELLDKVVARPDGLLGVGVAVPGVCDPATGIVHESVQLPGLKGDRLAAEVAGRFPGPLVIDNDSRAQALGERWFGEGRGVPRFASVQTGEGLGVGLVVDGAVLRGERGHPTELGHTCVVAGGDPCRCGQRGCWETVATLRWLRAEAEGRGLAGAPGVDAAILTARAEDGDRRAGDLLEDYAGNVAIGLANLVQLLGPQRIILHGDVVGGGERLRGLLTERTRARVLAHLRPSVEIVFSALDQRAGLLGAAGLVLSERFQLTV